MITNFLYKCEYILKMFGDNSKSMTRLNRVNSKEAMDVSASEKNTTEILTDSNFIDKLSDSQNVSMKESEEANDTHFLNTSQLEFL